MNEESRLMMQIWEAVSDFINSGEKQDAADAIVEAFVDSGHDVEQLYDAEGECPYIDRALTSAAAENEDIDENEDEDY